MEIVRKQLTASEVIPANQRYNPDTDTVEFSPDGGTTWIPMPSLDPRTSPAFLLPPLTGDARCDAAANMVKWIKDFLDQATELLGAGAEALAIVNAAIPLYELISGGSLTLLAIITETAGGLFSLGYAALLAAFDSTTYDDLLCAFYCNVSTNGQVTADQLVEIETQVTETLNTTAGIVVNTLLSLQGEVGLSNAGVIGAQTGDCSGCDCGWIACVDLTAGMEVFEFLSGSGGTWDGGIKPTVVLVGGDPSRPRKQAYFQIPALDSCTIVKLEQFYTRTCGVNPGSFAFNSFAHNSYASVLQVSSSCDGGPFVWAGSAVITDLQSNIASGGSDSGSSDLGDALLTLVRISGLGDPPSQLIPYLC